MSNKIKKYTEEEWTTLNNITPVKEQTNGERFDEFMKIVEDYPELEGTINLCNDIIEVETDFAALNAWKEYQHNDIVMTADAFFEGWKQAIEWMKNKNNEKK